jgi:hypothetical protein
VGSFFALMALTLKEKKVVFWHIAFSRDVVYNLVVQIPIDEKFGYNVYYFNK